MLKIDLKNKIIKRNIKKIFEHLNFCIYKINLFIPTFATRNYKNYDADYFSSYFPENNCTKN